MSASIKSVYLEDFQSHSKTKIELPGPGSLTVIVGPTDSGKTAIVRALRLLMYNVPQGIEYIQVGKAAATVAVEMSDGTKVARERSKSVNRYRVVRPGQQPQVLEGFGLSVPQEVREVTGVRTVAIGETLDLALNLSEQLDGPFLGKSVSGPAKAKILGALAGTEEVDEAQRVVGLDLHRAGQDEGRLSDEIAELDKGIAEYDYLPGLATQIEALAAIITSVKATQERLSALESAKARLVGIYNQQTDALRAISRWGGLTAAVSHVEYAEGALAKTQALSGCKVSLESIAAQRVEWGGRLARWAGLDAGSEAYNEAYLAALRQELLIGLAADLTTTRGGMAKARTTLNRWTHLDEANQLASEASAARERAASLFQLMYSLDRLHADAQDARESLTRWTNLADAESVVSGVPALESRFVALVRRREDLASLRRSRVVAEDSLSRHTKALTDAQSLYAETLVALGTCPLCGSRVSPESISLHIKEVA